MEKGSKKLGRQEEVNNTIIDTGKIKDFLLEKRFLSISRLV